MLFVSSPFAKGFICFVCCDGEVEGCDSFKWSIVLWYRSDGNYSHRRDLFES